NLPIFSTYPNVRYCDVTPPMQTQVKVNGAYSFPFDIHLSGTLQSYPGPQIQANWAAPVAAVTPSLGRPLAGGVRTVSLPLIQPGTLYGDRWNEIDLRVAKDFHVKGQRLQVFTDIINLLNSDGTLGVNATYGPNWLQPTQVLQARFFKMGAQLFF